ncbi:hypothetical protein FQN60_016750, partial [Etheostoma spectabile]
MTALLRVQGKSEDQQPVKILRDTACSQSLILSDVLPLGPSLSVCEPGEKGTVLVADAAAPFLLTREALIESQKNDPLLDNSRAPRVRAGSLITLNIKNILIRIHGQVVEGAVGMSFAIHEMIDNFFEGLIEKNSASQSLSDTANPNLEIDLILGEQFDHV